MTDAAITLVGPTECDALFKGQQKFTTPWPVTLSTWQHLHQQVCPVQPNPWWIACSLYDEPPPEATEIAAQNEPSMTALAWVDPMLEYFNGHFPGAPILPGVVQLNWAYALAEHLYQPGNFAGLARVKFKAPIAPGTILQYEMRPSTGKISLRIASNERLHTEGQLLYRG